jgi:chaperonin cofactor prefoldin
MILLVADPDRPKQSSLELVRKYKELEPELDALEDAPQKAEKCKAEIKRLSGNIHREEEGVKKITKAIDELDAKLADQAKKPKLRGKTVFGKGVLQQDQNLIDNLTKDKEEKEAKVVELKGQKEIDEMKLKALKEDLPSLARPAAKHAEIEQKMKELKSKAIDAEASALYLQLKAKGMQKEMHAEGELIFHRLLAKAEEGQPVGGDSNEYSA